MFCIEDRLTYSAVAAHQWSQWGTTCIHYQDSLMESGCAVSRLFPYCGSIWHTVLVW